MKSCDECKYYHAEYGGVCFAQKDAPPVFWQIAEDCNDFEYKDARILLDPISLSKEQVRDVYEFLNGKGNPTGEELYKNICEDISRAITERLTAEAERLIVAADREDENCETEPSCFNCRWCNTYTKWCCFSNESIDGRTNACAMWECDPYEKED